MNDNTLMPWGKHKGVKMCNVPASYLLWLYDEKVLTKVIRAYIADNLDGLRKEAKGE